MSEARGGDKTEAPSAKKLSDAAKRGDVLQSRELTTALSVAAGIGWMLIAGPALVTALAEQLRFGLALGPEDVRDFAPIGRLAALLLPLGVPMLVLAACMIGAGFAGPALLRSLGWRSSAFAFKGDRIDPMSGLKRMFGVAGLIELGRSLAKTLLLGVIAWAWLRQAQADIAGLSSAAGVPLGAMGALLVSLALWLLAGFIIIAMIDVPIQYVRRMGKLKMSLQDLRDEHKESEGAPEKKAAIRQRQSAILSRSMRAGVASASIIITNPQHFAVALRYVPGEDAAPIIVARGHDGLAAAIRDHARTCRVPILSAPPLARAIFFTGQVGQMVDTRLYLAVATLLAFLFRLDRQLAENAPLPELIIPAEVRFDADGRREAPSTA